MKPFVKKAITVVSALTVGVSVFGAVPAYGDEADKIIYINGVTGDDSNDGTTAENAVKSFGKVKELAKDPSVKEIVVTGEIIVVSEEKWDMSEAGNKPFVRDSGYTGRIVKVESGGNLEISNMTFDGKNIDNCYSVVRVESGAVFTMKDGAVIENNNKYTPGNKYEAVGGAVNVDGGTMNMEGGVIRNCSAVMGGGIGITHKGTLNMSGGTITGNTAGQDGDMDAGGGGVFLGTSSAMNMSGGVISNNSSGYTGGGVSMGIVGNSLVVSNTSTGYGDKMNLNMTGGTIIGNTAYNTGGGLFVQCNAVANVKEGNFIENKALCRGANGLYGGGGIYVNCGRNADHGNGSDKVYLEAGQLNVDKVEISSNSASEAGGGIAGCPTSVVEIDIANGSVIFENSAKTAADIFVSTSVGASAYKDKSQHYVAVSEYMLNGAPYLWKNDRNLNVSLDMLKNAGSVSLHNDYTSNDEAVKESVGMARVHILGNTSATRGGGIGTNGGVMIGEVPKKLIDIPVKKIWDDTDGDIDSRPKAIKIWLLRDGERVISQNMTKASGWAPITFKDQLEYNAKTGGKYVYSVEEDETLLNAQQGLIKGSNLFKTYDPKAEVDPDIENGLKLTNSIKRDLEISKTVVNEVDPDDDKKFDFTLEIKDPAGEPYEDKVWIISPDGTETETVLDNGTYTFSLGNAEKLTVKALKTGSTYTVKEAEVKNYKTKANGSDGTQCSGVINKEGNSEVQYENTYSEEETTTEETTTEETTNEETTTEETTTEETTTEETTTEETTTEETTTEETTTEETTTEETITEETTTEETTTEETTTEETTTEETTTEETTTEETTTEETTTEETTTEETTTTKESTTSEVITYNGKLVTTVNVDGKKSTSSASVEVKAGTVDVVDTIDYSGLTKDAVYEISGTLVCVDDDAVVATTTVDKKAKAESGTWEVTFEKVTLQEGKKYVVYELAVNKENEADRAEHRDINDKSQTIIVKREEETQTTTPEMTTTPEATTTTQETTTQETTTTAETTTTQETTTTLPETTTTSETTATIETTTPPETTTPEVTTTTTETESSSETETITTETIKPGIEESSESESNQETTESESSSETETIKPGTETSSVETDTSSTGGTTTAQDITTTGGSSQMHTDNPNTGDNNSMPLLTGIVCAASAGLVLTILIARKKEKGND